MVKNNSQSMGEYEPKARKTGRFEPPRFFLDRNNEELNIDAT